MVEWLLKVIGPKLDFRQYGGLKGNSITHYVIEFINFVLSSQDNNDQTAVLACFVDFQKAFMRQNHNTLIVKLSDLEVPGVESLASFKLGIKVFRTNNFYLQERRLKGEQQGNAGRFFER